jgi:hypothetical protein
MRLRTSSQIGRPQGRLPRTFGTNPRRVRHGGMRRKSEPQVKNRGPVSPPAPLLGMGGKESSPLRPWLRQGLRPWLRLSLREGIRPKGSQNPSQRRLRAWRFADIPTPLPGLNIKGVGAVLISPSIFAASHALDACAIASALAPQRFSDPTAPIALRATGIASALARHRLLVSALLSPRFAEECLWRRA